MNSQTSKKPGVLVLHGGAGRGRHEEARARMLEDLGYVTHVPDLFGETFTSREQGMKVIMGLVTQPTILRGRVADAVTALRAMPLVDAERIGVIGFCFGGLAALELARSGADVKAVVSFHGGLESRSAAEVGAVRSRVLVCTGSADPFVTRQHRAAFEDEMSRANAAFDIVVHGKAMHGFTEQTAHARPGCGYDERADRTSWALMKQLFDDAFA